MLYQKIPGPFKRDPETNKIDKTRWSSPELEALADVPMWAFTEKIDGTNVRILWDGFRITFGGRTDRAEMHGNLTACLNELFKDKEPLFEELFGESPAVLFGEGFGPGIQKNGARYGDKVQFAMFDVAIDDYYLRPADARAIGTKLGVPQVPAVGPRYSDLSGAIWMIEQGFLSSYGDFEVEGVVGVTNMGLLDRRGHRLSVKIKGCDF